MPEFDEYGIPIKSVAKPDVDEFGIPIRKPAQAQPQVSVPDYSKSFDFDKFNKANKEAQLNESSPGYLQQKANQEAIAPHIGLSVHDLSNRSAVEKPLVAPNTRPLNPIAPKPIAETPLNATYQRDENAITDERIIKGGKQNAAPTEDGIADWVIGRPIEGVASGLTHAYQGGQDIGQGHIGQGALKVIQGAGETAMGALGATPTGAAFNATIGAAESSLKDTPYEKYIGYAMSPITSSIHPESETGKSLAAIGDMLLPLLVMGGGEHLMADPYRVVDGEGKTIGRYKDIDAAKEATGEIKRQNLDANVSVKTSIINAKYGAEKGKEYAKSLLQKVANKEPLKPEEVDEVKDLMHDVSPETLSKVQDVAETQHQMPSSFTVQQKAEAAPLLQEQGVIQGKIDELKNDLADPNKKSFHESIGKKIAAQEELLKPIQEKLTQIADNENNGEQNPAQEENVQGEVKETPVEPQRQAEPEGEIVQQEQKEFTAENGNKVVDKEGKPITVYHGTNADFKDFDLDKTPEGDIWFTDNKGSIEKGESGASGGKVKNIMERQINLKNPAGWDEYDKYSLQQLREMGYDGVVLTDDGKTDYIVFDTKSIREVPKQIQQPINNITDENTELRKLQERQDGGQEGSIQADAQNANEENGQEKVIDEAAAPVSEEKPTILNQETDLNGGEKYPHLLTKEQYIKKHSRTPEDVDNEFSVETIEKNGTNDKGRPKTTKTYKIVSKNIGKVDVPDFKTKGEAQKWIKSNKDILQKSIDDFIQKQPTDLADTHKNEVKFQAGDEIKQYQEDIAKGKLTATDAVKIIESAGVEVPEDIKLLAENELKLQDNAITKSEEQQQESGEPSSIIEHQGTEGERNETSQPEANNSNSGERSTEEEKVGAPPDAELPKEEGEPSEPRVVGGSHKALSKVAERLGLEPIERGTVLTPEEWANRGRMLIDSGVNPEDIAADFKNGDDSNLAEKIAISTAHLIDLNKIADKAANDFGINSKEYADAKAAVNDWQKNVLKPMGTTWGDIGNSLQGQTDIVTGSFTQNVSAFEERQGRSATPEELAQIEELTKKITDQEQASKENIDKLTKLYEEANKRAEEAEKSKSPATKGREAGKRLATKIRSLKSKPFYDAEGNPIQIHKNAVLDMDAILEAVAKAAEKGGELADHITNVLNKTKLSDEDKAALKKQIQDHLTDDEKETPGEKAIKRLEKKLDDILENGSPEKKAKPEYTPEEKVEIDALKKQIQDIKDDEKVQQMQADFVDKKDSKFTPQEARDIFAYMKREYLDKGREFNDALVGTSKELGLSTKQVRDAIASPKGVKRLTDNQYLINRKRMDAITQAKRYIEKGNEGILEKVGKAIPRTLFALKVGFHGSVAPLTHAGEYVFHPSGWGAYSRLIKNTYRSAYGKNVATLRGKKFAESELARYEQRMQDLQNDPQYALAKRAGLQIDPNSSHSDDYNNIHLNKAGKFLSEAGVRGFNELKPFRLELFKKEYAKADDITRADPEALKSMAERINNSSGTTSMNVPSGYNLALFAPKLIVSKWKRAVTDPIKAVNTWTNWKNATPAQKVAAKYTARRVGEGLATTAALLAANQVYLSASGSKQKINFTDPTQSDWMKFKVGGQTVGESGGTRSEYAFIGGILKASFTDADKFMGEHRGKSRKQVFNDIVTKYAEQKLNPFASSALDATVFHQDYNGNTLPMYDDKPGPYGHQMSGLDYFMSFMPIPAAEAYNTTMDAMREQGMTKVQSENIMRGIIVGVVTGVIGAHVREDYNAEKPASTSTGNPVLDKTIKDTKEKASQVLNNPQTKNIIEQAKKQAKSLQKH